MPPPHRGWKIALYVTMLVVPGGSLAALGFAWFDHRRQRNAKDGARRAGRRPRRSRRHGGPPPNRCRCPRAATDHRPCASPPSWLRRLSAGRAPHGRRIPSSRQLAVMAGKPAARAGNIPVAAHRTLGAAQLSSRQLPFVRQRHDDRIARRRSPDVAPRQENHHAVRLPPARALRPLSAAVAVAVATAVLLAGCAVGLTITGPTRRSPPPTRKRRPAGRSRSPPTAPTAVRGGRSTTIRSSMR